MDRQQTSRLCCKIHCVVKFLHSISPKKIFIIRPDGRTTVKIKLVCSAEQASFCLVQIIFQLLAAAGVTQLAQRFCLDLADTLARHAEIIAHFLQRAGSSIV